MTELVEKLIGKMKNNRDKITTNHIEDLNKFDRSMILKGLCESLRIN
jgi:hypothetical protein